MADTVLSSILSGLYVNVNTLTDKVSSVNIKADNINTSLTGDYVTKASLTTTLTNYETTADLGDKLTATSTYINGQDATVLADAKTYASGTILVSAKAYTDAQDATVSANAVTSAVAGAKTYTDSQFGPYEPLASGTSTTYGNAIAKAIADTTTAGQNAADAVSTALETVSGTLNTKFDSYQTKALTDTQITEAITTASGAALTAAETYTNGQFSPFAPSAEGQTYGTGISTAIAAAQTAATNAGNVSAATVRTDFMAADAIIKTDVTTVSTNLATVSGDLDTLESNITTNYRTGTEISGYISTAKTAAIADAKTYTDTQISELGSYLTLKGTVATSGALPTSGKVGDVYIVTTDNSEYVCKTASVTNPATNAAWERLGSTVAADLDNYYTKTQIDTTLTNYYLKTETYSSTEIDNKDTTTLNSAKTYADNQITAYDGQISNLVTLVSNLQTKIDGMTVN